MRAAILLAAGEGRRFGRAPKQLAPRGGRPLIAHAVAAARAAPAGRVILVVGRQAERVARAARAADRRIVVVRARRWRDGQQASLAAAVAALWPVERAAFVFLGDMPDVPRDLARRLARCGGSARPTDRGRPGHPVLLEGAALRAGGLGRGIVMATVPADRRCRLDLDRRADLRRRVPALMR